MRAVCAGPYAYGPRRDFSRMLYILLTDFQRRKITFFTRNVETTKKMNQKIINSVFAQCELKRAHHDAYINLSEIKKHNNLSKTNFGMFLFTLLKAELDFEVGIKLQLDKNAFDKHLCLWGKWAEKLIYSIWCLNVTLDAKKS